MKNDTIITTAGRDPKNNFGIVNPPVYHASTIVSETVAELHDKRDKRWEPGVYTYGRQGTPTTEALEQAMAAVEGGWRGMTVACGLAAINAAVLAFVKSGDHVLMVDSTYGPARNFCNNFLGRFGVETTYYDPNIGAGIKDLIQDNTRIVYTESPGSLTFEVQDIPAIAAEAHKRGAVVIMDNTWSGGHYFKPFKHGVDVSVQAATKYIVGHSDAMLGTITTTEEHWRAVRASVGECAAPSGPDDIYLGLRGLRTLSVRLERHHKTGLTLANWLEARPEVKRVLHPGLPSNPGHELWKRDFTGASGLFGLVLNDYTDNAVAAMLDGLELYGMGASWGGFESLILPTKPGPMRSATPWNEGPSLRIHAGLEDPDDLMEDLDKGFQRLNASN
jgi:cysteine-S-conjugate beta-lyase